MQDNNKFCLWIYTNVAYYENIYCKDTHHFYNNGNF